MNDYTTSGQESDGTDIEPRTRRALERVYSVLHVDCTPIGDDETPTVVSVVSGNSGREHRVDASRSFIFRSRRLSARLCSRSASRMSASRSSKVSWCIPFGRAGRYGALFGCGALFSASARAKRFISGGCTNAYACNERNHTPRRSEGVRRRG